MGTLFESTLSTTSLRPHTTPTPSMADTLPSINFGFDDLRDCMLRFTNRFDDFIAKGRKRVLEERNQFRINVAEVKESQSRTETAISTLNTSSTTYTALLTRETAETTDLQSTIAMLSARLTSARTQNTTLRSSITSLASQITNRISAQSAFSDHLSTQASLNAPELAFWETYLGLRVEGAGMADRLRFIFEAIDERDWQREGEVEIDISQVDYRVVSTRPRLGTEEIEAQVEKLNEGRELVGFLKGVRALFVEEVKGRRE